MLKKKKYNALFCFQNVAVFWGNLTFILGVKMEVIYGGWRGSCNWEGVWRGCFSSWALVTQLCSPCENSWSSTLARHALFCHMACFNENVYMKWKSQLSKYMKQTPENCVLVRRLMHVPWSGDYPLLWQWRVLQFAFPTTRFNKS